LIAQLINLSRQDAFITHKKKYGLQGNSYQGLYGLEIREINSNPMDRLSEGTNAEFNNVYTLNSELFITGSIEQLKNTVESVNGLSTVSLKDEISKSICNFEEYCSHSYTFRKKEFDFKKSFVMGILNVTPDSFSDGGNYFDPETAVNFGLKMLEQGADIVDIGGESTRPGSDPVSSEEELKRVIPVINKILDANEDAVLSIDTTKTKVAEEALKCGAQIVNDISGGVFEPEIFNVAKEFNAGFVIMHIKGRPKTMQQNPGYENLVQEVYDFLAVQSAKAQAAGIEKLFLDPGIGFGKSVDDNFKLLKRLEDFKSLSFPLLIGLSRKSFIGKSLDLEMDERDETSNALNLLAIDRGARIIRTHNVKLGVQICRLMNEMIII